MILNYLLHNSYTLGDGTIIKLNGINYNIRKEDKIDYIKHKVIKKIYIIYRSRDTIIKTIYPYSYK